MRSLGYKPLKHARKSFLPSLAAALLILFTGCTDRRVVELPAISPTETQRHQPGRFVWHDLVTDDLPAAKRFYGNLFGWRFTDFTSGNFDYSVAWNHGRPISGLVAKDTEPPHPVSQWLSLLSVEDVDRAARLAEQSGGTVPLMPVNAPERGRFAVIRDPDGAPLTVIRTRWGDPEAIEPEEGDWFWNELWTEDIDRAARFYRELAGYRLDVMPHDSDHEAYRIFKRDGVPRAGAAKHPLTGGQPTWMPYVRVADLAGTVSRAESLGGKVLIAPRPDIRSGTVTVIADPSGATFGIQQIPPSK
ncbi:VOC family protein [Methylocaldum sp.]|uniref:VOC family protein n=1 Tax=Methylocaldum sp. TaxID=1969727 RepID=UPI002D2E496B|nr:VOC family protein [Methylocaldum sp.]HYE35171.1 VOC family protein [Methylocaldum sp.]